MLKRQDSRSVAIIISCASDESLASRLRDFLSKSKWLQFASISLNNDELKIEGSSDSVKHEDVKRLLEAFFASNDDLAKHSVTELKEIFIVGIHQPIEKLIRHNMRNVRVHYQYRIRLGYS